jgi:aspartate aminotransferase-like enzyme
MGLDLCANAEDATVLSNTVTAVSLPDPVTGDDADAFFDGVDARNVSISGGQGHLGGTIFRVSNMGGLPDEAILRGVRVVGEAMADAGVDIDIDAGVAAARGELGLAETAPADD